MLETFAGNVVLFLLSPLPLDSRASGFALHVFATLCHDNITIL